MTAQTLPDDPNYCFVPAYDIEDEVQQIRIVIEGMSGYIPTALVALRVSDGAGADATAWRRRSSASARPRAACAALFDRFA